MVGEIFALIVLAFILYKLFAYYYVTVPALAAFTLLRFSFVRRRDRQYDLLTDCLKCGGTGYEAGKTQTCDYCRPSGVCYVRLDSVACGHCGGQGKISNLEKRKQEFGFKEVEVDAPCLQCEATGQRRQLHVKFPNGTRTIMTQSFADPCKPRTRTREPEEYAPTTALLFESWGAGGFKEVL